MSSWVRKGWWSLAAASAMVVGACSSGTASSPSTRGTAGGSATTGTAATGTVGTGATGSPSAELPAGIKAVMGKPRYANATWSLLVTDVNTGQSFYALNADQMSFTGSTRKLFSVGTALNQLGPDHRETTPVHRVGTVDGQGSLNGNLVLVAAGDLTFGGRRVDANTIAVSDLDHNDAANLGDSQLTPQDPLHAVDDLAKQVKASGINSVSGDVVIDDRLFESYRVPNGNLLITPMLLNENMVDVTLTPTQPGQPATMDYRPKTAALAVNSSVSTSAAGTKSTVKFSDNQRVECVGSPGCTGMVNGEIPQDYSSPLLKQGSLISTFRVENPTAFARTAFIEALQRNGVTVTAPPVAANPATSGLPAAYGDDTKVASYQSPPYSQSAKLILKVSLNLGANLSLSLFGLEKGQRTIQGSLEAERKTLIDEYGVSADQFDFPTNGSGSPDSRAAPRAIVQLLTKMAKSPNASTYQSALPILGVDGSLAITGTSLPGKGHVYAKTGTTIAPGPDGETPELKAQNLAGYIETKSGRKVAYALMVNDAGEIKDIANDVGGVFEDEGVISSIIYETL